MSFIYKTHLNQQPHFISLDPTKEQLPVELNGGKYTAKLLDPKALGKWQVVCNTTKAIFLCIQAYLSFQPNANLDQRKWLWQSQKLEVELVLFSVHIANSEKTAKESIALTKANANLKSHLQRILNLKAGAEMVRVGLVDKLNEVRKYAKWADEQIKWLEQTQMPAKRRDNLIAHCKIIKETVDVFEEKEHSFMRNVHFLDAMHTWCSQRLKFSEKDHKKTDEVLCKICVE